MFEAISNLQNKPRVFTSEKETKRNVGRYAPEINTIYYRDGYAFASGGDLEEFIHVTQMSQTQELANKGWFVVAGWQNPIPGESGHVVVIVPEAEQAGRGGKVPMTWIQEPECEVNRKN